ncbi:MAG: hypothetical protein IJQ50_01110 [Clostridia bacterium]|nr:hypothetical protein [Clostridia bacterium]
MKDVLSTWRPFGIVCVVYGGATMPDDRLGCLCWFAGWLPPIHAGNGMLRNRA